MRFFFSSPSPSAIECFLVSRKRKIKKTISRPKEEGGERRAQAKREQRNRSRLRGKNTKREFPAGDVRNKSGEGKQKKKLGQKRKLKKPWRKTRLLKKLEMQAEQQLVKISKRPATNLVRLHLRPSRPLPQKGKGVEKEKWMSQKMGLGKGRKGCLLQKKLRRKKISRSLFFAARAKIAAGEERTPIWIFF